MLARLDEVEAYAMINSIPTLVSLFEVVLLQLTKHYKQVKPIVQDIQEFVRTEDNFRQELLHLCLVCENDLEELNLGMPTDPKIVKIDTWLPKELKATPQNL